MKAWHKVMVERGTKNPEKNGKNPVAGVEIDHTANVKGQMQSSARSQQQGRPGRERQDK